MEAQKQSGGEGQRQRQPMPIQYQYQYQQQQYAYPLQQQYQYQYEYGTFHPPPTSTTPPAIGIPQPSPPLHPGPGYAVLTEGRPGPITASRHQSSPSPPCCRIGIGWILFIAGFFFAAIPWHVGAFIFLCVRLDHNEKPGLIACTIAAVIAAFAVLLGLSNGSSIW